MSVKKDLRQSLLLDLFTDGLLASLPASDIAQTATWLQQLPLPGGSV